MENARQESMRSQDSCDIDIDTPPNYTAAATFPVSRDLVIHACIEMIILYDVAIQSLFCLCAQMLIKR